MSKINKIWLLFFIIILSIFISVVFWTSISLEYTNHKNVIGFYSDNNINPHSNLIKVVFFTFFPISIFFISLKLFFFKSTNLQEFLYYKKNDLFVKNTTLLLSLFFLYFLITLNYLSQNIDYKSVDYFHEGLTLSMGFNLIKTGKFWSGSYLSNSLLSDILSAVIPWKFFGIISIGAYKIFHFFLRYITEIFLLFFFYKFSYIFDFPKKKQTIFFLLLAIIGLELNRNITELFYPFRYRDIPIFVLLIFSIDLIKFNKNKILTPFLLGMCFVLSFFWSLDRGIYYSLGLIILILFLFFRKKFTSLIILFLSIILCWLIAFIALGSNEFNHFIINSINIFSDFNLFAGSIYPTIFDFRNDHSSRGTLNLFIIIINGFITSYIILNSKFHLRISSKTYLLLFFLISSIIYNSALGVPDSYHMKQSIYFSKIYLISSILFLIFNIRNTDNFKNINISLWSLIIIIFFYKINNLNYQNIYNFKTRIETTLERNDDYYTDYKYLSLKKFILENYNLNCIQLLSYDAIIPYLIRKPNCTKFNFLYVVSSDKVQEQYIEELKTNNVEVIIYNNNFDYIKLRPVNERFKLLQNFLDKNYNNVKKIYNWQIYVKKN